MSCQKLSWLRVHSKYIKFCGLLLLKTKLWSSPDEFGVKWMLFITQPKPQAKQSGPNNSRMLGPAGEPINAIFYCLCGLFLLQALPTTTIKLNTSVNNPTLIIVAALKFLVWDKTMQFMNSCAHTEIKCVSHLHTGCPGWTSLVGSWGHSGPHAGWTGRDRMYSCLQMAQYIASRSDDTLKRTQGTVLITQSHKAALQTEDAAPLCVLTTYLQKDQDWNKWMNDCYTLVKFQEKCLICGRKAATFTKKQPNRQKFCNHYTVSYSFTAGIFWKGVPKKLSKLPSYE